MPGKPISGRVFSGQVIRDNLDAGRPDQVSLIFARRLIRTGPRATPGRFRTRVITSGVSPSLHVDDEHATIKQYHKEGRALRTETTINDTRDFGIGKRLTNLPALREVGFSASRRLLRLERLSHDPITGAEAITAVTGPTLTGAGTRIPGLPLAQARSHALLAALLIFRLLPRGFTNRDLRELTAELRGLPAVTAGQITYDLRRLRSHHLIERIPPAGGDRAVEAPGVRASRPDDGTVDRGAYIFCVLEQFCRHLKHREIYAETSTRYRNPQARLLDGQEWEAVKDDVLTTLGLPEDPGALLASHVTALDEALRYVGGRLAANADVRVDDAGRIHVTSDKAIAEPPSLVELRRRVAAMLPRVDIGEQILEVMGWVPQFLESLTACRAGRPGWRT